MMDLQEFKNTLENDGFAFSNFIIYGEGDCSENWVKNDLEKEQIITVEICDGYAVISIEFTNPNKWLNYSVPRHPITGVRNFRTSYDETIWKLEDLKTKDLTLN